MICRRDQRSWSRFLSADKNIVETLDTVNEELQYVARMASEVDVEVGKINMPSSNDDEKKFWEI